MPAETQCLFMIIDFITRSDVQLPRIPDTNFVGD